MGGFRTRPNSFWFAGNSSFDPPEADLRQLGMSGHDRWDELARERGD